MIRTVKCKDIVQEIKGVSFDHLRELHFLVLFIQVFASLTESTRETKLNAYRKWGWLEEQIEYVLYPTCMKHSGEKIFGDYGLHCELNGYRFLAYCQMPRDFEL